MTSVGQATAPELQPPVRCFHLRDSNNRCHGAFPRAGLSIAILRGRIETWKEGVDRNLSSLNQLVGNRCFERAAGRESVRKSPSPSPLLGGADEGIEKGAHSGSLVA
ncbi:hypothetical protein D3C78_810650 [compost metagenome]